MIKLNLFLSILIISIIINSCGLLIKQPRTYENSSTTSNSVNNNLFTYSDSYKNFINPIITSESKSIIICIPGLGAHAGSYTYLQQYLTSQSISSVAIDLRGFGHCTEKKGNIENIGLHITDINEIVDFYRLNYPTKRIYLLGESLGSSLAIWYSSIYHDKIHGLILTSLVTNKGENKVEFKSVFNLFLGYCFYPNKPINLGYNPEIYCNDSIFNNWAFKEDTLGTNSISVKYLIQSNRVIKKSYSQICQQNNVLLMQGGNDFLSDINEVEKIIENCNTNHITFKYYKNNNHSLVNDTNRIKVYEAIINWINQ